MIAHRFSCEEPDFQAQSSLTMLQLYTVYGSPVARSPELEAAMTLYNT